MTTVRHTDGIEIELSDGRVVAADARRPTADINVCSHAHGDHLFGEPPESILCSELTPDLAAARRDGRPAVGTHPAVELLNAGHIPGSRATLITDSETGDWILYTGDVSTRDRFYLDGFEPVSA